jgi:hypothetical protein
VELLLIPVLLDLLLWLAPRLSVAPLFDRLSAFYRQAASLQEMPVEMKELVNQTALMVAETGRNSNLLEMFVSTSLLHVPSLLVTLEPLPGVSVLEIVNPFTSFALFSLFGLTGILIGVTYLNLLAQRLPLGHVPKKLTGQEFMKVVLRHWLLVLLFVLLVAVLLFAGSIPVLITITLLTLISPALASLLAVVLSGIMVVIFFYLYFVTSGMILDDLPLPAAVLQSFILVRNHFWPTLGFILLTNFISLGFALIMDRLAVFIPVGTIMAILINAYIGTGLAMALLVFYRTRLLGAEDKTRNEPNRA